MLIGKKPIIVWMFYEHLCVWYVCIYLYLSVQQLKDLRYSLLVPFTSQWWGRLFFVCFVLLTAFGGKNIEWIWTCGRYSRKLVIWKVWEFPPWVEGNSFPFQEGREVLSVNRCGNWLRKHNLFAGFLWETLTLYLSPPTWSMWSDKRRQ